LNSESSVYSENLNSEVTAIHYVCDCKVPQTAGHSVKTSSDALANWTAGHNMSIN